MNIQEASQMTGVSRDMIRHYEKLGLLTPRRLVNGYRDFSSSDLNRIVLIKGFSNLGIELKYLKSSMQKDGMSQLAIRLRERLDELRLYLRSLEAEISMGASLLTYYEDLAQNRSGSIAPAPERILIPRKEKGHGLYEHCLQILEAGGIYHYYYRIRREAPLTQSGLLLYPPFPQGIQGGEIRTVGNVYRAALLRRSTDEYITWEELAEHFDAIRAQGFRPAADVLMYQISEFQEGDTSRCLICVEIPVERA